MIYGESNFLYFSMKTRCSVLFLMEFCGIKHINCNSVVSTIKYRIILPKLKRSGHQYTLNVSNSTLSNPQTHKLNHAIFMFVNIIPLKNHFVFHIYDVETCQALLQSRRFLYMFDSPLTPSNPATLYC